MADEKSKSKGERRYANGPKVKPKGNTSQGTDSKPEATKPTTEGAAPEATVLNGADGVPVTERHSRERGEMMERHVADMKDMHKRHGTEHEAMLGRQMEEAGGMTAEDDA